MILLFKRFITLPFIILPLVSSLDAQTLYYDTFDKDGLDKNKGVGGGAASYSIESSRWSDEGNGTYIAGAARDKSSNRAILVSKQAFRSEDGFTLNIRYYSNENKVAEQLSFGLISNETKLPRFTGYNPFVIEKKIYGFGVNTISGAKQDTKSQGAYFGDGLISKQLDQSGTRAQFITKKPTTVTLEVEKGGYWCYRIDGVYEDSGVIAEGIDLNKSYHVVVYGRGVESKILDYIKLDKGYAAGERAASSRGTWSGGMGLDKIQDLRTLDTVQVRFTDGATLSASHWAPHKLLEKLAGGDKDEKGNPINLCVPTWGDLSKDTPENDPIREKMLAIKAAGFKVKAYANCENFNGRNNPIYEVICERWKKYCDTNPEAIAFVKSQPFHTGIWDKQQKKYIDATAKYPNRKYMFCYAEYVLKDYALRYGDLIDTWIFDSGGSINAEGDIQAKGVLEEQRLYQAFAKAVHAGNPNIAIAFNNGRSRVKSASFPFATPTHYDDYTFGHAFGGNNNHGAKPGTYDRNYLHVKKMAATNGYVFTGGPWTWDDKIVGNFHSKLSTSGWKTGWKQAWEEADFLKWNLEAMQAGGIMTWDGSATSRNRNWVLRGWSYNLLKALDDHLAKHESPNTPNWARAYTVLPDMVPGKSYKHILTVGEDLWDPEGDKIVEITKTGDAASWMSIKRDPINKNQWILSGSPTSSVKKSAEFTLHAKDAKGNIGSREVILKLATEKK